MKLPDPLHPALVHFPIVLILIGMAVAVIAVFWRKGYIPIFAAALLTCGALGAWVALATGKSDGGLVETLSAPAEALLEAHETWAERTVTAATTAAVLAIGAIATFRFPRVMRGLSVATALVAMVAAWTVFETGHRGGAMVYKHGIGVSASSATPSLATERAGKLVDRD
jgi:uncharacterized membrane protein